ncbi:hypothetical protein C8R43DRAFT_883018 [Mycena crocata]|nr:hypothetical protein C8R43DRAFT_883018 [Mycena crocata]
MRPYSDESVQVTGVSGFVGSHVAAQLLAEGYGVRGTARGDNIAKLKAATVGQNPKFDVIQVEDIASSDLKDALKDVNYVIHTASPLAGQATAADGLRVRISALRGTLNVLEQAEKAGIPKVVLTSSWATTMDPSMDKVYQDVILSQNDWGMATEADILADSNGPLWNYVASKILAEVGAWKFAEDHPMLDLTTINPPFIYGPLHPDFPIPARTRLGANEILYALIAGEPGGPLPPQLPPFYCDVRDVARAHVRSLKIGKHAGEQKRFLVSGGMFTLKDAVEYLTTARPELRARLLSIKGAQPLLGPLAANDVSPAKFELGLDEYISWEKSVSDALDSIMELEKEWK